MLSLLEWVPLLESERLPAACGLYIIRHKLEGKEYVGKSVNVRKRMRGHRQMKSPHSFHRALRKHGLDAFEVCLFATGTDAEMKALEVLEIARRGTYGGYNATRGGDGAEGATWSAESRAAASARRKGVPNSPETKAKMSVVATLNNPFKGKKHTAETLAKVSAAAISSNTGRVWTSEGRARMSEATKGKKMPPVSEETKLKISLSQKGVSVPSRGKPGKLNPMYGRTGSSSPFAKAVQVFVPGLKVTLEFSTGKEAAAWANTKTMNISNWCSGRSKPKDGYLWSYK